jgi:multiple inositol-polyphosphate phosphatase / 2,3-bisphosphoglycerate 3-phosphatase
MNLTVASILLALASIVSAQSVQEPNYCYATDVIRPQRPRWADRTSNDFVRGTFNPQASTCVPARFWLFMRHGDRLPSTNDINRMIPFNNTQAVNIRNSCNAGQCHTVCSQDIHYINQWRWNPNITTSIEQFLTVGGWNGVAALARRYQQAFPTLLPSTYDRTRFSFQHTDRQRTQATVRAFADGLFGDQAYRNVFFPAPPNPDPLLRPHDNCPLYDQASNTQAERDRWQNSAEFQQTLNTINNRLGLVGGQRMSARQMRTMWEICQFEQLWYPATTAPFCGVISPFDNLRLEYFEDIDEFYTAGYGLNPVRLAENLPCNLMQDMLQFLTSTNPNEETVRIYSSHQTAFLLFVTSLGIFRDAVPITAANFEQQANRLWVTSRMTPMAANIAAVRYK